ncbi:PepSY1/2 domain-containing protein [Ruminococcus sp.]|uniref:PepSY1/2 domain-containing protein n=1 Tax=Ruminococcus sp. TaxID=41978 RepID=UPI0025D7BE89|nr:PepSY1/2 domain-containing protein [Ruminococcus sp.]MBQ8966337.1 germination protein YpeB [Ruminococcus sp.]
MTLKKRGLIRLCSLSLAAVGALSVKNYSLMRKAEAAQRSVNNSYTAAVEELAGSCENLSNVLEKQLYAGSGRIQQSLSADLYKEAAAAKAALSRLPVSRGDLENTNKFLSQVGNYSLTLSQKLDKGEALTAEEYSNISKLCRFSKQLCDSLWELEGEIAGGELTFEQADGMLTDKEPPHVTEGFTDFEGSFDEYPKLIYDGPFSDDLLEQEPLMTKDAEAVTEEYARDQAAEALGISTADLTDTAEVGGKMPAWRFSDEEGSAFCEVTKQGGYISYFLNMRDAGQEKIGRDTALDNAADFLERLGMTSMEVTYYEIQNGAMTVNFCYLDEDRRVYPDLAKVTVAMDNGDILGYDARGFLVNHRRRTYRDKLCSALKARQAVSPRLDILSERMAVIPTDGGGEVLCREYTCKAGSGRKVLVYVNACTAEEEQVLLLEENENGTLTV